jgi:hypothetical protein
MKLFDYGRRNFGVGESVDAIWARHNPAWHESNVRHAGCFGIERALVLKYLADFQTMNDLARRSHVVKLPLDFYLCGIRDRSLPDDYHLDWLPKGC